MHCQDYRISACSSNGVCEYANEPSTASATDVAKDCNTSHLASGDVVILPTKAPKTLSKFELFRQKQAESKHFSRWSRCISLRNTITLLIGLVAVAALVIAIYDLSRNANRSDRTPPGGGDGMEVNAQPLARNHSTSSPDSNLLNNVGAVPFNANIWSSAAPEVNSHLTGYANFTASPDGVAVRYVNSTTLSTTTAVGKNRSSSTHATTLPLFFVAVGCVIVAYFYESLSAPRSVTVP